MERFDAIVVGAGPAGSTTAHLLARAGVSTLLVDRARFPRDKPCGGALTFRAVRQLPVSIDPVLEDVVDRFVLRLGYRRSVERSSKSPLCLMTQRRRLDAYLAAQATVAGATFRDGVKVSEVALSQDGVTAVIDSRPVTARVLIGADGANGITRRSLGFDSCELSVALEGNVPYGVVDADRYRGRLVLELGVVPGGYGWVFPKGDHVNVGVGGWASEGRNLRDRLSRLCAQHDVPVSALTEVRGHHLPMRRPESQLVAGRVALVGDAAGLIDPLSGDGIFEALVSARLAVAAALDLLAGRTGDLSAYEQAVQRTLAPLAVASWAAKLALERYPRLTFSLARARITWPVIERVVRGDIVNPADVRGLGRAPLRIVDALARSAPRPEAPTAQPLVGA